MIQLNPRLLIVVENETIIAELKANERKRNKARVPKTG